MIVRKRRTILQVLAFRESRILSAGSESFPGYFSSRCLLLFQAAAVRIKKRGMTQKRCQSTFSSRKAIFFLRFLIFLCQEIQILLSCELYVPLTEKKKICSLFLLFRKIFQKDSLSSAQVRISSSSCERFSGSITVVAKSVKYPSRASTRR